MTPDLDRWALRAFFYTEYRIGTHVPYQIPAKPLRADFNDRIAVINPLNDFL
jgi:hypothetical protein